MKRLIPLGLALLLGAPLTGQERTRSPHGDLALECETCHRSDGWTPARISRAFDHAKSGFPLLGAHKTATCRGCHEGLDFKGATITCASCHQDVHRGELGADCTRCHTPRSFLDRSTMTRAHQSTRFPLEGGHLATDCTSCHKPTDQGRMQFVAVAADCWSCHQQQYIGAKSPDHVASGMPHGCEGCHSTIMWGRGRFNHDATRFPLSGAHRATNCTGCHANGRYAGTPLNCVDCHQQNYDRSTQPNHRQAGFVTECASCHTTQAWNTGFDHGRTQFPLTGAHGSVSCQQCHADGVYRGKSTTCVSCHQDEYNQAATPNHRQAGFPTDCQACHTTVVWTGSVYNHDQTQFPLTGAHKAAACAQCHGDGIYDGKATACASCHQSEYNGTTNPKHSLPAFPTNCASCHGTTTWTGAVVNHDLTAFPLSGAHRAATCDQCHRNGQYTGTVSTCIGCHQTDYNGTSNPRHSTAGFSTTCSSCHSTNQWTGAVFNHGATQFPLTGAHITTSCNQCHADGVYDGKPTTCVSCHQADFNRTADPPHAQAGFSTTCTTCHSTTTWVGGTFNHSTTQFPLTGAHVTTQCSQCHGDGVYNGKPTTCESCHQTDYNQTTNPNHQASGFSTTCSSCHTTTTWQGATFNHDGQFFPIYSGKHKQKWNACTDCHAVPADYAQFTCLTCHEHNKTDMDSKHRNRSGYAYVSTECLRCHPRGS